MSVLRNLHVYMYVQIHVHVYTCTVHVHVHVDGNAMSLFNVPQLQMDQKTCIASSVSAEMFENFRKGVFQIVARP